MKETQLERVVRKSEDGDFGDGVTIRISRHGHSLSMVDVEPEKLKDKLLEMSGNADLYNEIFSNIKCRYKNER